MLFWERRIASLADILIIIPLYKMYFQIYGETLKRKPTYKKFSNNLVSVFLVQFLFPKDTLLRTNLTSLQLVTGTVLRRLNVSLPFTIV